MAATNGDGKGAMIVEEQRQKKAVYQNQAGMAQTAVAACAHIKVRILHK